MAYVITQNCCKDASCLPVCPVDCIRPADGSDGTSMLYIDPEFCIDCGACEDACPVDAIHYGEALPSDQVGFKEINAAYFQRNPLEPSAALQPAGRRAIPEGALRVAVVGTGPAGCYAAAELLAIDGVNVDMFERLPTPYGLVRAGVAPDHQRTKAISRMFERLLDANDRVRCYLNTEIGVDLSHDDLLSHYHAVVFATGAAQGRRLEVPGGDLPGVHPAADFVGWYNGHPDHAHHQFDLSGRRAVVIGNGNVALDIARVLLLTEAARETTDMADHALLALRDSHVDEVVIIGRRGLSDAAFTLGEFMALGQIPGLNVVVNDEDLVSVTGDLETALKLQYAQGYARRNLTSDGRRVSFRFNATPTEITGITAAEGVTILARGGLRSEHIDAQLILTSIGYKSDGIRGLAAPDSRGAVLNDAGRVVDEQGVPRLGVYVTGWLKRGPSGVIGTNRACAAETVATLLSDFDEDKLNSPIHSANNLDAVLSVRGAAPTTWSHWRDLDGEERKRGALSNRPRVKFVSVPEMLAWGRA